MKAVIRFHLHSWLEATGLCLIKLTNYYLGKITISLSKSVSNCAVVTVLHDSSCCKMRLVCKVCLVDDSHTRWQSSLWSSREKISTHLTPYKSKYYWQRGGRNSSDGIATRYGLGGPGIESRWGRDFPHPSRPALWPTKPPVQWVPGLCRG